MSDSIESRELTTMLGIKRDFINIVASETLNCRENQLEAISKFNRIDG